MPFLKYGRSVSLDILASGTPYFSYTLDKTILNRFVCVHPRHPPSGVCNPKSVSTTENSKKDIQVDALFAILGA